MRKISAVKNQYFGINAHLHSFWQAQGGWREFHTAHIVDLTRQLKLDLRPLGYTASIEDSLQIRRSDFEERRPESDVAIYDKDPVRPFMPVSPVAVAVPQAAILTMPDVMVDYEELSEYRAISIHSSEERNEERTLVAWIELLSPSNKLQDVHPYRKKRFDLLSNGIVFIEIDYLHESPPTISRIPNYAAWRRRQQIPSNAHPYRIVVIDPRPEVMKGKAFDHEFDVDMPIPQVNIPLNQDDNLDFDFDSVYQKTLTETLFALEFVDYSQLPINFERYVPADRQRIAMRMVTILEAACAGNNLETAPFPCREITHSEALVRIEALQKQLSA